MVKSQMGALDKWADEVLINGLKRTRLVRYIATRRAARDN